MPLLVGFHRRNEKMQRNFSKNFFGIYTPKIDGKIQCNFKEDAERWQKIDRKTQSTFVFYFVGFSKFDRKMQQKIWEKTVCLWTLYKTNFCLYSWLDLHQQLIFLKRLHCCNASDWIGLL